MGTMKLRRSCLVVGLCVLALPLVGCGPAEEASKTGDDPNSAAVMNKAPASNPGKEAAGGNRDSGQKMPEGAGRAPVTNDMLPPPR